MVCTLRFHPMLVEDLLKADQSGSSFSRNHRRASSTLTSTGIDNTSTETEYRMEMDMPGIKSNDLDVTVKEESGLISISGIRKYANNQGETIKKARVSKTFSVDSATVDLSKLSANLSDGVLVVTAPKKPKSMLRKIAVTTVPHATQDEESIECDKINDKKEDANDDSGDAATKKNKNQSKKQ